jgi:hypothetical protein
VSSQAHCQIRLEYLLKSSENDDVSM